MTSASHGHPRGLYTLFFTEMWERFSYYGMRALLVLFMTDAVVHGGMGMTDKIATAIYGLYTASVYLAAFPGGWVADRFCGAQRSVWYGGANRGYFDRGRGPDAALRETCQNLDARCRVNAAGSGDLPWPRSVGWLDQHGIE